MQAQILEITIKFNIKIAEVKSNVILIEEKPIVSVNQSCIRVMRISGSPLLEDSRLPFER